jgi:hypothetical protein
VTVVNVNTGVTFKAVSNESGVYIFPPLQPGTYKVTCEMPSFKTLVYDNLKLEVSAHVSLNLNLELGIQSQTIEVQATLEDKLGLATASVGGMITAQMARDLPLSSANILNLTSLQAGVDGSYFDGARYGALNITLNGVNVQDNRINSGIFSSIGVSQDLVQEIRVVTSPADAEFGRGSGQIQMVTRTGTNEFHGSLWDSVRNDALNANSWGNNRQGADPKTGLPVAPRSILKRNQFGARLGGPIVKNKTFFFFLYEGQRQASRSNATATVLTDTAKQGLYRFFPGVLNANADAITPTVDLAGNPVKPATATGDLQTVSLFGRDPNRMVPDPTGIIKAMMDKLPSANYFRTGDGLNTAGFRWIRKSYDNSNRYTVRIDHYLSDKHRLSFDYALEKEFWNQDLMPQAYPSSPPDDALSRTTFYNLAIASTIRPNLINQGHVSAIRPTVRWHAFWELPGGMDRLPKVGSNPYLIVNSRISDPLYTGQDPQGRLTPVYQYSDTISWMKGKHYLVGGAELRRVSTNGFNSFTVMPRANIGAGGAPVQNITNIPFIGQNSSIATDILNELAGSVGSFQQAFNSPGGKNPTFLAGEGKVRHWKATELSFFFKDDWKISPAVTLNLGVRWEWYGVPYDSNGKTTAPVGGTAGVFGVSGIGMDALFQPGLSKGQLTRTQLVGPNSPNPDIPLYNDDWNNFAPAVGISWSIPYFGRNKTVLRTGYGWSYERSSFRMIDVISGDLPGLRVVTTTQSGSYMNLANTQFPLTPAGAPLSTIPIDERTQTMRSFDNNLRTPYTQNFNVSLQREIVKNLTLEVRYVGSKTTKAINGIEMNERNIFAKGANGESILDAFKTTQKGGNSPLLDQIFMGLTQSGQTVNGTTFTGSDLVRYNSTTAGYLANTGGVGSFANWLWTTTTYTNQVGGLPRRVGLPENWIAVNPQVANTRLTMNCCNQTYHALQIEVNKRFSSGFSLQSNYAFSKALGDDTGSGQEQNFTYRTLRNQPLQKHILTIVTPHTWRTNTTYTLPFGPGKSFLTTQHSLVRRLVEGWTVGAIFIVHSGGYLNLSSGMNSYNTAGSNTPNLVGSLLKSTGGVYVNEKSEINYFKGFTQVTDPFVASLTTLRNVQSLSTLKAIADPSGNIILINPLPGTLGSLGQYYLTGPGDFELDMNLIKRVRIDENRTFEMRVTAFNISNTPQWGNPTTDINSTNFGRITSASGNRTVFIELRLNF